MCKDERDEIMNVIHRFSHRQENGEYILMFTEQEVARLRRLLTGLLNGSYYRSGERAPGADVDAVFKQDTVEFTATRLAEVAGFYEMAPAEFLEDLTCDDYCESELKARSYPYEDPW
ncbi:MAG: hypothetical protein LBL42_08250 [Tannerella sp.]|jgi:hypothetical protein|nr:hypothetical protein [Tannerella sp.]